LGLTVSVANAKSKALAANRVARAEMAAEVAELAHLAQAFQGFAIPFRPLGNP